jgi:hypothetical protein
MKSITLLDIGMANDGHRSAYVDFLSRLFNVERMGFCRKAIFSPAPVLVPMIEESLATYALTAAIRSMMGRRTTGFLFRPRPAVEGTTLRLRIKRLVLKLLRRLPQVHTLTILPFSVEPRFSEIANGWIHDPQLWDLDVEQAIAGDVQGELATEVRALAAGRQICLALGRQDADKGFDWFADLYAGNPELRGTMLFTFGGKVSADLGGQLAAFVAAGGHACNRFVTDEELLMLYASAHLVWCAYASGYDQASGIFGRAVQLGIPVAVRRGSLIHRMCEIEEINHVAIDETSDGTSLAFPSAREPIEIARGRTRRMRSESMHRLYSALGIGS